MGCSLPSSSVHGIFQARVLEWGAIAFSMTNLDSILKSRDITLPTKVRLVKAMVFPVVMYGCESWTVKKTDLLQNGLVGSPCSPGDSQESSPAPQFESIHSSGLRLKKLHNLFRAPQERLISTLHSVSWDDFSGSGGAIFKTTHSVAGELMPVSAESPDGAVSQRPQLFHVGLAVGCLVAGFQS